MGLQPVRRTEQGLQTGTRRTVPARAEVVKGKAPMVFVVDTEHKPLSPCHPARARLLLTRGKAAVWRRSPFTRPPSPDPLHRTPFTRPPSPDPLRMKIDP